MKNVSLYFSAEHIICDLSMAFPCCSGNTHNLQLQGSYKKTKQNFFPNTVNPFNFAATKFCDFNGSKFHYFKNFFFSSCTHVIMMSKNIHEY